MFWGLISQVEILKVVAPDMQTKPFTPQSNDTLLTPSAGYVKVAHVPTYSLPEFTIISLRAGTVSPIFSASPEAQRVVLRL